MIFVIGGRGRLGRALLEQYRFHPVVAIDRAIYDSWGDDDATYCIERYFAEHSTPGSLIYVCSGLLDPKLPVDHLHRVNFTLPRNIIRAVAQLGLRVVTFGTAMEGTLASNPYVQSKLALAQFVQSLSFAAAGGVTHIRIHTLYGGGEPSAFMFLGLMLRAIRTDQPFAMTKGKQLREYHHVDDDAAAIRHLMQRQVTGVVTLSHGRPVMLQHVAHAVFDTLGKSALLQLGALPEPAEENFAHVFQRPESLQNVKFRQTLGGVAQYMKSLAEV